MTVASLYYQVLAATKAAIESIAFVSAREWTVKLRKAPSFYPLIDRLPQIIIAPRPDLVELIEGLTMGRRGVSRPSYASLGFEAYVGLVVDSRPDDTDLLDLRFQFREEARLKLWEPGVLGLDSVGEYDVEYDPQGEGGEQPPPNTDGSWQRFRFTLRTLRSA